MMAMMVFWWLVPLVLIGAVAYALVRRPRFNQTDPTQPSHTPAEILKARYASGEITRAEYDQIRRDLEG
jgi:uncharacterized membrane protein